MDPLLRLKGVFPLNPTNFRTFNSPHEWLEAILDNESTQLDKCVVEEVRRYKHTSGNEHELLRLQVGLVDSPQKACIIAERTVDVQGKKDKLALSSNLASSSPFSPEVPAIDAITCAYLNSKGYEDLVHRRRLNECKPIEILTFDACATRPSILQIATLMKATSSHAPSYSLVRHQCYWFTATVVDALVILFSIALQSVEPPRKNGTYRGMSVPMADSVPQVCDAYREQLSAVYDEIKETERRRGEQRSSQKQTLQEARDGGRAEGHAEERAALEKERAVLAEWKRELEMCEKALEARVLRPGYRY